jgi:uncharacterized protein YutE (UPF0331/DUF86 family)
MLTSTLLDALAQKAARMRRCVERAREEHALATCFATDFSRQDAAILNIQRACDLAIDMANMVISHEKWGLPRSAKDVFFLLQERGGLAPDLSESVQNTVGFRNIAVHQYEPLNIAIVEIVITQKLDELLRFAGVVLSRTHKQL